MPSCSFEDITATMRRSAAVLRDAEVPFALAGGLAAWARGSVEVEHDVDFVILPADIDRALHAFEEAGFRTERPIEGWLVKAWQDDVLVDLIFEMAHDPTGPLIENATTLDVLAVEMPVMTASDVLVSKLNAITEQDLQFAPVLRQARNLREQIDWDYVSRRTKASPFAVAFLTLTAQLGISPSTTLPA